MDAKPLHISGAVFVYACLTLTLVAIVAAAVSLVFATNALHDQRDLALKAVELQRDLTRCTLAAARLEGRVVSFERVLISPKRTAIEASLLEFTEVYAGGQGGGDGTEPTLAQFERWFRGAH